ncbi:MAG TPA: hypothetical protein ENJ50_03290, partial [Planctomycetaceae bacterium]|nr:hypothetical protein [Planctomycetaceae bacterium]
MAADFDFSDDSILVVPDDCQGLRAAEVLARFWPELRRTAIRQVVREGKVERNGTPLRLHDKLRPGDVIFCRDFDPES